MKTSKSEEGRTSGLWRTNLTIIYISALTSIALVAMLFYVTKGQVYKSQLDTIRSIRLIDRQVSLNERLVREFIEMNLSSTPDVDKEDFRETFAAFNGTHGEIVKLLSENLPCHTESCKAFLNPEAFKHFAPMKKMQRAGDGMNVTRILETLSAYTIFLESSGNFFESLANSNTNSAIRLDLWFILVLLIMLVLQALFIFRPAVNRMNDALSVRSDFLSRISHEIRNPMNAILGMTDVLRSTKLSPQQTQYTDNILRSGNALLEMLNNLVDFSALELGKIQLKPSNFRIYNLIDKCVDIVSVGAHDKGVEVFVNIDPKIPRTLNGDSVKIQQVLINFLNNALKFTKKGSIRLDLTKVGGDGVKSVDVEFRVQDTGIGIDKDQVNKIFERFVQEDSSIQRRFGGSGLGLAISKEIVDLMGSEIIIESEKKQGTVFKFTISLGVAEAPKIQLLAKRPQLIYVSGLSDNRPIQDCLELSGIPSMICDGSENFPQLLQSLDGPCEVIVDDSLGIINMINIVALADGHSEDHIIHALVGSNFPKENMDMMRKNGFRNFMFKPFRTWHLDDHKKNFYVQSGVSQSPDSKSKPGTHPNVRVLAVDDSNDNLFLMQEILRPLTSNIDLAENGKVALEKFSKAHYDIVFMDIQMPVMDGYSAIHKIRKIDKENTPVFAVTAHAGLVEERKCLEAGFSGRITKPINREILFSVIFKHLGLKTKGLPKVKSSALESKMIQKLLPSYFKTRAKDIGTLRESLESGDYAMVRRVGHRMKGSAKSYGFPEIGRLSEELELASDRADHKRCCAITSKIEDILTASKVNSVGLSNSTPKGS